MCIMFYVQLAKNKLKLNDGSYDFKENWNDKFSSLLKMNSFGINNNIGFRVEL